MSERTTRPFLDPRGLLGRHGLRPKRSFGQNFLVAPHVVERIAALCVRDDDPRPTRVIEIGAGLGALTNALIGRADSVAAIERDRDLVPVLEAELADDVTAGRLSIVEADAATLDYRALFAERPAATRVLAGNLPYQITGRLIEVATELADQVARVVVMVQREVADRLAAEAGSKTYGQLSVFVQAAFTVRRALSVSAGSFLPAPEVESAVVELRPRADRVPETKAFREVVHLAFGARRKTLRNALGALARDPVVAAAIDGVGIDLQRRGETLDVSEFARLAAAVERAKSA